MTILEKITDSAPIMSIMMDWICLCAIVVLLLGIAILLPRNKVLLKVIRGLAVVGMLAVAIIPAVTTLIPDTSAEMLFKDRFAVYVLLVLAVVVLYGMFFDKAYLTQALYGMSIGVAMPLGLFGLIIPAWMESASFAVMLSTPSDLLLLLVYAALFFVPVWLIATGSYRLRLNTIWHQLLGFAFFGTLLVFSIEMKAVYSDSLMKVLNIFGAEGINMENLEMVGVGCGMALIVIVLLAVIATIIRAITKSGKAITSECSSALILRTIGNIVSVAVPLVAIVLLPNMMNANTQDTLAGMPKACLFLAPLLVMAIVPLLTAYFAERNEINHAQAQLAAYAEDDETTEYAYDENGEPVYPTEEYAVDEEFSSEETPNIEYAPSLEEEPVVDENATQEPQTTDEQLIEEPTSKKAKKDKKKKKKKESEDSIQEDSIPTEVSSSDMPYEELENAPVEEVESVPVEEEATTEDTVAQEPQAEEQITEEPASKKTKKAKKSKKTEDTVATEAPISDVPNEEVESAPVEEEPTNEETVAQEPQAEEQVTEEPASKKTKKAKKSKKTEDTVATEVSSSDMPNEEVESVQVEEATNEETVAQEPQADEQVMEEPAENNASEPPVENTSTENLPTEEPVKRKARNTKKDKK